MAELGPFFAVTLDPSGPEWTSLAEAGAGVVGRVERLRARYAQDVDLRACASTDFLGLVARIVSPPLAAAVRFGVVPDWQLDMLFRHYESGALGSTADVVEVAAGDAAAALTRSVIEPVLAGLVTIYADTFHVSGRVLWGNVASALAGAATVLGDAEALNVVERLVGSGSLTDTGFYERPGQFRRRSCCLYYRLPRGGLCGDCVLAGA